MKLSQTLASTAISICLHLFRLGSAAPTFDSALSKRIAPAPPVLTKCSSPDESRNQVSMIFTWKDLLTQTNSPNAEIGEIWLRASEAFRAAY